MQLLGHSEFLGERAPEGSGLWPHPPLDHQARTFLALRDHWVVVNCCDTGTGKTEAALRALLLPGLARQGALIIAPTNELLQQHAADVRRFVQDQGLPHRVQAVFAAEMEGFRQQGPARRERRGEALERLLNEMHGSAQDGRSPLLVVTNPDIFYYMLYHAGYHPNDRRNLFAALMMRFGYLVVDEVHYYTPKQLACFLFYFAIWKEWGFFQKGGRACLLSATPDPLLDTYLRRLFPEPEQVAWVRPGDPPAAACALTPTLAPVTVDIVAGDVDTWVMGEGHGRLAAWLGDGQDGAVISGALWRINAVHQSLRGDPRFRGRVARLTGAETRAARQAAPSFPLVLATPTVDIGYNFERPGKDRQALDFIVADAQRGDEAIQRLGRAGRVLGRVRTDARSHAVLLLPEEACVALQGLDGQTMERRAFRRALEGALPARSGLEPYLRSYAVLEAFRPIFAIQRHMLAGTEAFVDRLIDRVWSVFCPGPRPWRDGYAFGLWRRQEARASLAFGRSSDASGFIRDYLEWLASGGIEDVCLQALEVELRRNDAAVQALVLPWVCAEHAKWEALLRFRDAFEGPDAGVVDRDHLLSGADAAVYDLLHVVSNFEAEWFPSRDALVALVGVDPGEGCAAYARLRRQRPADERLRLRFDLTVTDMHPEQWRSLHTRRPVALRGLRLRAVSADGSTVPISPEVRRAIEDRFVPALLVPDADAGAFRLQLRHQGASGRALQVTFPGEDGTELFWAVVGTAAFTTHAALRGYFGLKERREATRPFIV